jgi:heterodisulfide reductase subunit B
MKASLFPGCALEGTAREYGESLEAVCEPLQVELEELSSWSCCGATCAHCTNEYLSVALPARNLYLAEKQQQDLVVPCAACFSRLKAAEKALTGEKPVDVSIPFSGDIEILHLLEFFVRNDFLDRIENVVTKPLSGLRAVSYYGCLIVRPPRVTGVGDWEDPQDLDRLMTCLGGESVFWPYKTDCCGGSLVLTTPEIVYRLSGRLLNMVKEVEADCIVTACPLCQSNLDTRQEEIGAKEGTSYDIPVFYFTELMGLAFGLEQAENWVKRHIVDPRPLLKQKGLL